MNPPDSAYFNLLEPPDFMRLFMEFPPRSFESRTDHNNYPLFLTDFDILTTLEQKLRGRIKTLPLFKHWSGLLKFPACFCGTTITEYAPVPASAAPDDLPKELKREFNNKSMIIIKDLPSSSPLLPEQDNAFCDELTAKSLDRGYIAAQGQALAYVPIDFADQDEYLNRLSSSRRKDLRRKLKKLPELDIETRPLGDAFFFQEDFLEQAYGLYLEVFKQSAVQFDLLSREFFRALLRSDSIDGVVFLYRHQGRLAGYNICLISNSMLIDKYIGLSYPLARQLNLYFISWLVNLDYARQNGLSAYVAGWTDPEVKAALGARFTWTRHLIWIKNPLLRAVLSCLKPLFESDRQIMEQRHV